MTLKLAILCAVWMAGCSDSETVRAPPATETAMPESSPILPETVDLAGAWTLASDGGACEAILQTREAPLTANSLAAPMFAIEGLSGCGGLDRVAGWRPMPLGLEMVGADGMALMVFETIGPQRLRSGDQRWILSRP